MTIYVVANEPEAYRKMANIVKADLPTDFIVEGSEKRYAFERKTPTDLAASNRDGRLWEQCKTLVALREQGYKPAIVIVGERYLAMKYAHLTLAEWLGTQRGIMGFGLPIIQVKDENEFKFFLGICDRAAGEKSAYRRPTLPKAHRSLREERIDMLIAVEGIGEKTANDLLSEFRTIEGILKAAKSRSTSLNSKKAKHLRGVLIG